MLRRPPSAKRTNTLFPYTTLFRSVPDYAIGTVGDLNIIGAQTGERRYDLLKWRYGRKFTRHRPIRCAFKTVLHHHAISAGKLYYSCNRNRCVAVASHSRSEEHPVGKECVSTGRFRWAPYQ